MYWMSLDFWHMYTSCSHEMGCKGEFQLNLLCPPTTKLWYWPNLWTETGGGGRFLNEQERDFWRPVLGRSLPLYWAGCFFLLIFHPNWGFSRNFFQKLSSSEVLEVVLVHTWKICCSFIILVAVTSNNDKDLQGAPYFSSKDQNNLQNLWGRKFLKEISGKSSVGVEN